MVSYDFELIENEKKITFHKKLHFPQNRIQGLNLKRIYLLFVGLLISIVGVLSVFTTMLVLRPLSFLSDIFEIEPYADENLFFRITILAFPLIHLTISYGIEVSIRSVVAVFFLLQHLRHYRYM